MLDLMSEVTRILSAIERGDPSAAEQLLPLVYDELRQLAAQKLTPDQPGQTLQATALVHEAYLRLVGGETPQRWDGRRHFFAAAAEAMRRILVEAARRKNSLKCGGRQVRVSLDEVVTKPSGDPADVLAVDEGGGLERLAGLLVGQPAGGERPEFVVDERQEVGGRVGVAGRGGVEESGEVTHADELTGRRTGEQEPPVRGSGAL